MFRQADLQRLNDIDSFLELSDRDFEWCCKFLLEKLEYGKIFVTKKGPKGGDGGIDLNIYSSENKIVACVQCKQWKRRFKGLMQPVRELCGSMKIKGVSRGFLIITVKATQEEKHEARQMNIEIIDSTALLEMVKRFQTSDTHAITGTYLNNIHKQKEKNSTGHKIAKIIFSIIGFLLMTMGYVFIGALIIIFTILFLLFLGLGVTGSNKRKYYSKRYRRSGKKYYRRRRKNGYIY